MRAVVNADLPYYAKYVGLYVGTFYMHWDSLGDVRPGTPRTARETGLSVRQAQRGFNELVRTGYLEKVSKGHFGSATLYVGRFPKAGALPVVERVPPGDLPPAACAVCGRVVPLSSRVQGVCDSCAGPAGPRR